jgi:glycosyltransferase involved in cell wall biosynthesis
MKVIIASTIVPFVEGGGTFIVDWLDEMLKRYGHEVEVLKLPFHSYYPEMFDQMLALRLLDIAEHADRLIAIRTPSYLLRHPKKVLWFIHHHRGAYDLWGTKYGDIPSTPEGRRYREAFIRADNVAFREARSIFTNSKVVADRLKRFNNVDSEVLYPPVMDPERYRTDSYGDCIFYPSRLTRHKRQHLAIGTLSYTKTPVKLVIAGQPEDGRYLDELQAVVDQRGLADRVKIISRWITEEEKVNLFASCLAAIYVPFDEDSYGYPSLEAHHAAKCVITTSDAGGTRELVVDGDNGFLTAPDPKALAGVMDRLYLDRELARRMGERGAQRLGELGISWDRVVEKLLA